MSRVSASQLSSFSVTPVKASSVAVTGASVPPLPLTPLTVTVIGTVAVSVPPLHCIGFSVDAGEGISPADRCIIDGVDGDGNGCAVGAAVAIGNRVSVCHQRRGLRNYRWDKGDHASGIDGDWNRQGDQCVAIAACRMLRTSRCHSRTPVKASPLVPSLMR